MGRSVEIPAANPEAMVTAPKTPAALQLLEASTTLSGNVGVRGEFTRNSTARRIDGYEQAT